MSLMARNGPRLTPANALRQGHSKRSEQYRSAGLNDISVITP